MSWSKASPEAKARCKPVKNAGRRARYAYMRDVIGAPPWKCREGQQSVLAMKAYYPEHQFPPELVERKRPGRKPRAGG